MGQPDAKLRIGGVTIARMADATGSELEITVLTGMTDGLELSNELRHVKAALLYADRVRLVSPTVAMLEMFATIADGSDSELEPLATAVEQTVRPPYRARAARQSETLWAVQAKRIEVMAIPDGPLGDSIDLTHTADGTTYAVDDERQFGSVPVLEERGAREGREYTVHADRLDGDLWEIRAAAL